jgi:putative SOS response-associated peptidase YedK
MCSRVHQSADPFVVRNLIEKPDALPSQELLVFRKSPTGEIVDGYLRWGLIPHYAYARPDIQPVNARAESVAEKPMFKEAYRKRRCIVPMDAFYEKKKGRVYKFFMKDRQPFGVAGIWENWRNQAGDWERTFCIITVEANDLVRKIHDRMPAIITAGEHQTWFDGADDLLVPYPADKMNVLPA